MTSLPPPGRWALGADAQVAAEALVRLAQAAGLRTAWVGPRAGFLSNLDLLENLRLVHDWDRRDGATFAASLERALQLLALPRPEWLRQRPAQLQAPQLQQAAVLRAALMAPDLLVLHPASLAGEGAPFAARLVAAFAGARLLLLADPTPEWPAWSPSVPAAAAEETAR